MIKPNTKGIHNMKKFIRKGVFETNSSSTHSICIGKEDKRFCTDKLPIDEQGRIMIWPGEFGWEIDHYNDAVTKASYCLTWAKQYNKEDVVYVNMLKKVISEQMNVSKDKIIFRTINDDTYYPNGYIDHQSIYVAQKAFESEDSLRAFIFNPESILITDNDNH